MVERGILGDIPASLDLTQAGRADTGRDLIATNRRLPCVFSNSRVSVSDLINGVLSHLVDFCEFSVGMVLWFLK